MGDSMGKADSSAVKLSDIDSGQKKRRLSKDEERLYSLAYTYLKKYSVEDLARKAGVQTVQAARFLEQKFEQVQHDAAGKIADVAIASTVKTKKITPEKQQCISNFKSLIAALYGHGVIDPYGLLADLFPSSPTTKTTFIRWDNEEMSPGTSTVLLRGLSAILKINPKMWHNSEIRWEEETLNRLVEQHSNVSP